jgi:hypothetical protein
MSRACKTLLSGALFLLAAAAGGIGVKTEFVGGTLPNVAPKSTGRLDLTGAETLKFSSAKFELEIAYRKVDSLEYGQHVSRRYAEAILLSPILLLSKSRKHFVTLGYEDAAGQHQALVFRVDKGDIRSVLASLETRSGRKVVFQDDDARKAGQ